MFGVGIPLFRLVPHNDHKRAHTLHLKKWRDWEKCACLVCKRAEPSLPLGGVSSPKRSSESASFQLVARRPVHTSSSLTLCPMSDSSSMWRVWLKKQGKTRGKRVFSIGHWHGSVRTLHQGRKTSSLLSRCTCYLFFFFKKYILLCLLLVVVVFNMDGFIHIYICLNCVHFLSFIYYCYSQRAQRTCDKYRYV